MFVKRTAAENEPPFMRDCLTASAGISTDQALMEAMDTILTSLSRSKVTSDSFCLGWGLTCPLNCWEPMQNTSGTSSDRLAMNHLQIIQNSFLKIRQPQYVSPTLANKYCFLFWCGYNHFDMTWTCFLDFVAAEGYSHSVCGFEEPILTSFEGKVKREGETIQDGSIEVLTCWTGNTRVTCNKYSHLEGNPLYQFTLI